MRSQICNQPNHYDVFIYSQGLLYQQTISLLYVVCRADAIYSMRFTEGKDDYILASSKTRYSPFSNATRHITFRLVYENSSKFAR